MFTFDLNVNFVKPLQRYKFTRVSLYTKEWKAVKPD